MKQTFQGGLIAMVATFQGSWLRGELTVFGIQKIVGGGIYIVG